MKAEDESLVVPAGNEAAAGFGWVWVICLAAELPHPPNRGRDVIDAEIDDHASVLVPIVKASADPASLDPRVVAGRRGERPIEEFAEERLRTGGVRNADLEVRRFAGHALRLYASGRRRGRRA